MKNPTFPILSGLYVFSICTAALSAPVAASTVSGVTVPALQKTNPVIITELQTASSPSGKSDEFIELYNASESPVDITGWQVRYLNASTESGNSTLIATIALGKNAEQVVLQPGEYFVLRTPSVSVDPLLRTQVYDAKLSNAEKAVVLLRPHPQTCFYEVQDVVAWGTGAKSETRPLSVPVLERNAERHLERYRDIAGVYVDTNNTYYDLRLTPATSTSTTTPGALNAATKDTSDDPLIFTQLPDFGTMSVAGCEVPSDEPGEPEPPVTVPPTVEPPIDVVFPPEPEPAAPPKGNSVVELPPKNVGLMALQITEVLPNPASPQTDAADEFIEFYNANSQPFDLSGYVLEVGSSSKRRYVFPAGTIVAAAQFKAFFSSETKLSLSNSGGQVTLLDPRGNSIASIEPYGAAKDGLSWARANGKWQWTTKPTPHAANAIVVPPVKTSAAAKKSASSKTSVTAKSASTSNTAAKAGAEKDGGLSMASPSPDRPIHKAILVLVGVMAVLYGLYEYRHDLANYFYRLRANRAARREARSKA